MTTTPPEAALALRSLAEKQAALMPEIPEAVTPEEARQVLHELRVHQIELEMQNEELRCAHVELEVSRERYFDLYDLAPVGYLTLSVPGLILEANLAAATFLGMTRGDLVKRPFSSFIYHEDKDRYYLHSNQLLTSGEPQRCEVRLVRKDAAPFWARYQAITAQDADGAPVCRVVVSDITERRQAEQQKIDTMNYLQTLMRTSPVGIITYKATGEAVSANEAATRIVGTTIENLLQQNFRRLESWQRFGLLELADRALATGVEQRGDLHAVSTYGHEVDIDCHFVSFMFGGDLHLLFAGMDITARKQAENELRHIKELLEAVNLELEQAVKSEQQLAHTDELTGVNNHRFLMELATRVFDVATRYQHPLSVMMFDIDRFKEVNDTLGHAVGDRILEQVVSVAGAGLRAADIIGRYGGDEFVIVLPMTTAQQAFPVAERIRAAVAAIRTPPPHVDIAVTISIGIAEMVHPPQEDTVAHVINRADEAMYSAKQAGRNRTETYCAALPGTERRAAIMPAQPLSIETLRHFAEDRVREQISVPAALSPDAARNLPHELRVQQIQLEMQNDELRRTQEELEASRARYFYLYELAPVGFITLSEEGLILEANLTAATLLGTARGAMTRQQLTRFIVPEDQDLYYRHRQDLLATGKMQVCELRMMKRDGTHFHARLEATAAQGADGAPEYRALLSEITGRDPGGGRVTAGEKNAGVVIDGTSGATTMKNSPTVSGQALRARAEQQFSQTPVKQK